MHKGIVRGKKVGLGPREKAQRPEFDASPHMVAHNHLFLQFQGIGSPLLASLDTR